MPKMKRWIYCGWIAVLANFVSPVASAAWAQSSFSDLPSRASLMSFDSKVDSSVSNQPRIPDPPVGVFEKVYYRSPGAGDLGALITPDTGGGERRPAIIWLTGGLTNAIGDVWTAQPPENDQTASAYREAGIVMMFPSLRGGNDNWGKVEWMYGEVDDVIEAAKYLAGLPYVDPERIYLGGHSTGGTLAVLVAESTDMFRSVFAFGPVHDATIYSDIAGIDFDNLHVFGRSADDLAMEKLMRMPVVWLKDVKRPLYVIEGVHEGNVEALRFMDETTDNPNIHFLEIGWANHFSTLAPTNRIIAQKILADRSDIPLTLTDADLPPAPEKEKLQKRKQKRKRESDQQIRP